MPYHPVIVIGAGPGGVAAAVQCKRLGVHPLLLEKAGHAGGLIKNGVSIENYPGLESPISGQTFAERLACQLKRFQIELRSDTVTRITQGPNANWSVNTTQNQYQCDAVIAATGTLPKSLEIDGAQQALSAQKLHYHIYPLLTQHPTPQKAIIIGGGEASFDYSLSLAQAGSDVVLLVRRALPKVQGRLVTLVDKQPRISIRLNTSADLITIENKTINVQIHPSDKPHITSTISCDTLLSATGRYSSIQSLIPDFKLSNSHLPLTPAPGLFICGDARLGSLGQAGIAVGDGLAAAAMAVEKVTERKSN